LMPKTFASWDHSCNPSCQSLRASL
jgi:hypothetical protein